ncbi:ABC transporter permease [Amycolatopsis suaedae]|uniref:ABC transporter permease n=1 Tax=Amycolatopsis suaedae TaxID=2510978 RepID=A0A4Q7J914_9PSEU|nr:ABC transporter permease [Amycolatopsis suaedae]RZQ63416.1 ABC transporter permease [Amycolatopsis suaedae]
MSTPTVNGATTIRAHHPSTLDQTGTTVQPNTDSPPETVTPNRSARTQRTNVAKKPTTTKKTTTTQTAKTKPTATRKKTQAPVVKRPKPWPLIIIGAAAAVAVWSGWVGLGQMAGFGIITPLPGIWDALRINTAVVLPLSVEAYAAYALRVWLGTSKDSSQRTQRFAKWSAIGSLVIGAIAQVAYHLMAAAGYTKAPWPIVMLVAIIPVIVLGLASALAKLVTNDTKEK